MCKLSLTSTRKQIFFPSKHLTKGTDQVSTRAPLTNTMLYISDFYCIPNLIFISSFTGGPDRDTIIFCFIELNKTRATERLFYSITAASQTFWFRKALRCLGVNHSLPSPLGWYKLQDNSGQVKQNPFGRNGNESFFPEVLLHVLNNCILAPKWEQIGQDQSVILQTASICKCARNIWSKRPD